MTLISLLASVSTSIANAFGSGSTADKMHVAAPDARLRDLGLERHDVPANNIARVDAQIDRNRLNAWI